MKPSAGNGLLVRSMTAADATAVCGIYQAELDGGLASFETVTPAWEAFDRARLPEHSRSRVSGTT